MELNWISVEHGDLMRGWTTFVQLYIIICSSYALVINIDYIISSNCTLCQNGIMVSKHGNPKEISWKTDPFKFIIFI